MIDFMPSTHRSKHGMSKTRTYATYHAMLNRCYNERSTEAFDKYGKRGITVCERWRGDDGFTNFLDDMGQKTSHLIE